MVLLTTMIYFSKVMAEILELGLCQTAVSILMLEIWLLIKVFPGKKFTVMSPLEAELTKYIHNVFGAYKVTYFNAAKEYVEKMGGDWAKVHTGVLLSGYINDTHTYVPGPDGKLGYGGKCFPKDVNAFAKMTEGTSMGTLLAPLHELNVHFRGVEEYI